LTKFSWIKSLLSLIAALGGFADLQAAEVSVAVASNFSAPMKRIAQMFQQASGHTANLSIGSTGSFYAQIKNGAPFQVLVSADDETPARLEQEGDGVAQTRFTYAVGRLALWSSKPAKVDDRGEVLRQGHFERLAIANPKLAPYGAAAQQTLTSMGLWSSLQPKLVLGESIAQTYQFIASDNAQVGFVALSQIWMNGQILQGSAWIVPASMHEPLQQDVILLRSGRDSPAAKELMRFLRSETVQALIRSYGYDLKML